MEENYYERGMELLSGNNPEGAVSCFEKELEINPADWRVYFSLGMANQNLRKWEEAVNYFEKAVDLKKDLAIAHLQLGIISMIQKDHGRADNEKALAMEMEPQSREEFSLIWDISITQEELNEDPYSVIARIKMSELLLARQRSHEAFVYLLEAYMLEPGIEWLKKLLEGMDVDTEKLLEQRGEFMDSLKNSLIKKDDENNII